MNMILLLFLAGSVSFSQPPSDEVVIGMLVRSAASESAGRTEGSALVMRVQPSDINPIVTQIFSEELTRAGKLVYLERGKSPVEMVIQGREMNSSTAPLTNSSYLRTASITIGVHVEDRAAGRIAWSKEFRLVRTDTLDGTPPYEMRDFLREEQASWFDSFIAPAIAATAAVIIIVLLFTVRGS